MRKSKRDAIWKKLKPCAICGDVTNVHMMIRGYPRTSKKYSFRCFYCGHQSPGARTERGAVKLWNRETNIVKVEDDITSAFEEGITI